MVNLFTVSLGNHRHHQKPIVARVLAGWLYDNNIESENIFLVKQDYIKWEKWLSSLRPFRFCQLKINLIFINFSHSFLFNFLIPREKKGKQTNFYMNTKIHWLARKLCRRIPIYMMNVFFLSFYFSLWHLKTLMVFLQIVQSSDSKITFLTTQQRIKQ